MGPSYDYGKAMPSSLSPFPAGASVASMNQQTAPNLVGYSSYAPPSARQQPASAAAVGTFAAPSAASTLPPAAQRQQVTARLPARTVSDTAALNLRAAGP